MLKPSLNNNFDKKINLESYQSGKRVLNKTYYKARNRFLVIFAVFILIFFLWDVTSYNVTTLTPNNRPQTVVAPLEGRIENWFVTEGTYVEILLIIRGKSAYLDRNLIQRTKNSLQRKSKV